MLAALQRTGSHVEAPQEKAYFIVTHEVEDIEHAKKVRHEITRVIKTVNPKAFYKFKGVFE